MTLTALLIGALVILVGASLAAWSWLVMAQVEDDLRSIGGFDRLPVGS